MKSKPPQCDGCPARDRSVGFVPPAGPESATLAIVGQGPGEQEATFDQPFYPLAPSGSMLTRWLSRAGFKRSELLITNSVWCWLPAKRFNSTSGQGNRDPQPQEIAECWKRHLGPLLLRMPNLQRIVPVGTPALRWFFSLPAGRAAERYAGTTRRVDLLQLGQDGQQGDDDDGNER